MSAATDRRPRLTVAAVAERDGRYLMVEETVDGGRTVFNQPAGHVEAGESLIDAVVRETLEETAADFAPDAVVGIYRWTSPGGVTFLRVCFAGRCTGSDPQRPLDEGIVAAVWLTRDELAHAADRLRSPLVLRCIDDHAAGVRYPLQLLSDVEEGGGRAGGDPVL